MKAVICGCLGTSFDTAHPPEKKLLRPNEGRSLGMALNSCGGLGKASLSVCTWFSATSMGHINKRVVMWDCVGTSVKAVAVGEQVYLSIRDGTVLCSRCKA